MMGLTFVGGTAQLPISRAHRQATQSRRQGTVSRYVEPTADRWSSGGLIGSAREGGDSWMTRIAAREMLKGVDMVDEDFGMPNLSVTCAHIAEMGPDSVFAELQALISESITTLGGKPYIFGTPVVEMIDSEGARQSVLSPDLIAKCIETMQDYYAIDAELALSGSDKTLPGALAPMLRHDSMGLVLFAGNVTSADEGEGGSSTYIMPVIMEALGMSVPYSALHSPLTSEGRLSIGKKGDCHTSVDALFYCLRTGLTARQICAKAAFENAITIMMALGGSTHTMLQLLALAAEAEVDLTFEDFIRISKQVPLIADFKPVGKHNMGDLEKIGGVPTVMKYLLNQGFINGGCITVTGRTISEVCEMAPDLPAGQELIRPISEPVAWHSCRLGHRRGRRALDDQQIRLFTYRFEGPRR